MDGRRLDEEWEDSDADWDSVSSRPSHLQAPPDSSIERLGWVVLVLLTFCPAAGLALALWLKH